VHEAKSAALVAVTIAREALLQPDGSLDGEKLAAVRRRLAEASAGLWVRGETAEAIAAALTACVHAAAYTSRRSGAAEQAILGGVDRLLSLLPSVSEMAA
jgi:predicted transcriptional regulator